MPLENNVYDFLTRLSLKKIINLQDEVKPFSRKYIASLLDQARSRSSELNNVENDELTWFLKEYSYELGNRKSPEKWYLYSYQDSLFSLKLVPQFGYGISSIAGKSGYTKWPGAAVYGTYADLLGVSFSYVDKGEFGDHIDVSKKLSPLTGAFNHDAPGGFETSDVKASISLDWKWGNLSLSKDYMEWGHGKFGNVILSDKAPSYPQLRLSLQPVKWLRFHYMHGWLNSLVADSSNFFFSHNESSVPYLRRPFIKKYIAANMLTISPLDWLDLSVGNSFIYSGELRPEMFIPFMYYKVMDHNTGREGFDDGNGSIFVDVKADYFKNTSVYASLMMDVIELRDLLKNVWYTSWFAYTAGVQMTDFFLPNLTFSLEYTKVGPWVYENKDESTTYKHYNYSLGHWIGQNADLLKLQLDYQLMRGLKFTAYGEGLRKGGLEDIAFAYTKRKELPFLYGPFRKDFTLGFACNYEILRDLYLDAGYKYSDIKDEDKARTQDFLLGEKNSWNLTLHYGF